MLERPLAFAHVGEAEFVYRTRAHGPSVTKIPLLEAFGDETAETGHVGACELEVREGLQDAVVIEIVISAEILFVVDAMIEADRKLISARRFDRHRLELIPAAVRQRNVAKQSPRSRIHARNWNLIVGENVAIQHPV